MIGSEPESSKSSTTEWSPSKKLTKTHIALYTSRTASHADAFSNSVSGAALFEKLTSGVVCPAGEKATSGVVCPAGEKATSGAVCPAGEKATSGAVCPAGEKATSGVVCSVGEKATSGVWGGLLWGCLLHRTRRCFLPACFICDVLLIALIYSHLLFGHLPISHWCYLLHKLSPFHFQVACNVFDDFYARWAVVSLAVVVDGVLRQIQVVGKFLAQFGLGDPDALVSASVDVSSERRSEFNVAECKVVAILTDQAARSPCSHWWSPLLVWVLSSVGAVSSFSRAVVSQRRSGSCRHNALISWGVVPVSRFGIS